MDATTLLAAYALLAKPIVFAGLAGLAIFLVWLALMPAARRNVVGDRLDGYLERPEGVDEMSRPFAQRALIPFARGMLRAFGRIAPRRNIEMTRLMLLQAGQPLGISVIDFFGLRLLAAVLAAVLVFLALAPGRPFLSALLFGIVGGLFGFLLPIWGLRYLLGRRRHAILRALPDALDMLTIGVEAGLAFDSALLRVGEKWHNELTREFNRAVAEMRVGTPRDAALKRMVERCGVVDLSTFVAVLIQSSQLGVSIAQVLHEQAAEMRIKRQQRAEELARQAGVKMVIPLVLFIFPDLFIVILGPSAPEFLALLRNAAAGR